ncbi:helix-turn-helix domain-containing protein [Paenibacillus sp. PK3_47]|uniref:helix-turn-helix domain-containing protein n=1 Tax=Paenibacillus sp. PK3_47 TaxID=2072642 RepID=UPI00201E71FE|nr:helix-turn-helix domain-containing protein [Paenibacillus sp. PK3_47]
MLDSLKLEKEIPSCRPERADLAEIRAYMARHYHEPLTIGQLAGMAGLKPKYFGDLFKKTYGQSAMDYLTDLRMSRAKQYLQESDYLLREIAERVGYSDEFYFSRKFKKEFGMPPTAFVRQQKRRIAVTSAAGTGQLLALDIIPAAAPLDSKWTFFYYNQYYAEIGTHLRVDLMDQATEMDKLIRSRPDAIIGHEALSAEWRESLCRNVQTLFIPEEQDRWDIQLYEIAVFFGRKRQYNEWMQKHKRKAEMVKRELAAEVGDDTCLVLRFSRNQLYLYSNRGIRDTLFGELGLQPAYAQNGMLYNEPVTLDEIQRMNPQRLMMIICPDSVTRMHWLSLQHSGSWRSLDAVMNNEMYQLPSDPWFEYSATAIDRMLEEILLMFTGKCPGPQQDEVHG